MIGFRGSWHPDNGTQRMNNYDTNAHIFVYRRSYTTQLSLFSVCVGVRSGQVNFHLCYLCFLVLVLPLQTVTASWSFGSVSSPRGTPVLLQRYALPYRQPVLFGRQPSVCAPP